VVVNYYLPLSVALRVVPVALRVVLVALRVVPVVLVARVVRVCVQQVALFVLRAQGSQRVCRVVLVVRVAPFHAPVFVPFVVVRAQVAAQNVVRVVRVAPRIFVPVVPFVLVPAALDPSAHFVPFVVVRAQVAAQNVVLVAPRVFVQFPYGAQYFVHHGVYQPLCGQY